MQSAKDPLSAALGRLQVDHSGDPTPLTTVIISAGKSRSKPVRTWHTRATGVGSGGDLTSVNLKFLCGACGELAHSICLDVN